MVMKLVREFKSLRGINYIVSCLLIIWLLFLDRWTNPIAQVEVLAIFILAAMSLIVRARKSEFSDEDDLLWMLVVIEIGVVFSLSAAGLRANSFVPSHWLLFWPPFIVGAIGVVISMIVLSVGLTVSAEKHPDQETAMPA
jgi:hypothetical protein